MTEPIYRFEPSNPDDAPLDDPETLAVLENMKNDPKWAETEARMDERFGVQLDYHCVVTNRDGSLVSSFVPSRNDAGAIKLFDQMVMSWHHCRSLIPYLTLKERTHFPDAVRLELISPDGMRRLSDFPLDTAR